MASAGGARFLIFLATLAFLPGSLAALLWSVQELFARQSVALALAGGFFLGLLVDQMLLRRLHGFETFEHELTHAISSLLFFRRVTGFKVTARDGGWVQHTGGFGGVVGDDFIGLAPYVLPTFTVLSVLVRPFLQLGWFPWFDIWIGVTLGFHTWSTVRETRQAWTSRTFILAGTSSEVTHSDIGTRGRLYSAVYILSVTSAIHAFLFAIIAHGYAGAGPWWRWLWGGSVAFWTMCWHTLREAVAGLR